MTHDTVYRGYGSAYIADCVLDKYIREYGGEDTLYHFKMITGQEKQAVAEEFYGTYFVEIYKEDVKLYVAWTGYIDSVVSVLIEGDENAQPRMQEFVSYARYSAVDYHDKHYHHEKRTYWTLVNPEVTRNERCYRNINPADAVSGNGEMENDVLLHDIADLVLNKYIMEWLGSDTIYQIEWNIEEGDDWYSIKLNNGEEMLQVRYQPDSWLVSVEVVKGPEE